MAYNFDNIGLLTNYNGVSPHLHQDTSNTHYMGVYNQLTTPLQCASKETLSNNKF